MKKSILLSSVCILGALLALTLMVSVIVPDPTARSNSELEQLLKESRTEAEQYRLRVVEWSHYAWKLEHEQE